MKDTRQPFHPVLAAGFLLNALRILLSFWITLPDFAMGFLEGVSVALILLGAILTILSPQRLARLRAWKRRVLFGGDGTC